MNSYELPKYILKLFLSKEYINTYSKRYKKKKTCNKKLVEGRWQSRSHQESISPPKQELYWHNLTSVTILEPWSLFKSLQLLGKGLDSKSQLISVNFNSHYGSSYPPQGPPPHLAIGSHAHTYA